MKQVKRLYLFVFSLLVFYNFSIANSNQDSLLTKLQNSNHDTLRFDLLIEIGDFYEYSQPDSAIAYYTKAEIVADQLIENYDQSDSKFFKLKSKALRYIGYVHLNQGDYKTATEKYFQALEIAESINDSVNLYNCYNNIGIINHMQKEYSVAEGYYSKALEITNKTGNEFGKSKLYINMGNLYFDLGDNTDSIPERKEFYNLAQKNYETAQEIKRKVGDKKGHSLCCNNLGNLSKKSANIHDDEDLKKIFFADAAKNYRISIQLSEEINDKSGLSMVFANMADLFSMQNELKDLSKSEKKNLADSALYYGVKAYYLAVELNSVYLQNEIAALLKNFYSQTGNVNKALEFANIYIETKEKLFSEEKTKALKEMLTKYETEKKEKEIQLQQLKLQKTQFRMVLVLSVAGLFTIIISFLGYVLRLKQKTEKVLELKNRQLLESNATKDKFFSIISHDLRSPVSGFRNLSFLIGQNFETLSPEQVKENIIDLSKSADETVSLLNNLLQWSKSQQNKIEVNKFPANIKRLFSKTFSELGTKLKEKNIHLHADIDDSYEAEIDENIISTVLRNLLTNAIKFSPSSSTLEVNVLDSNEFYKISVKDQGIGMSDEDMKKLFRIECDTKSIGSSPEKGSGLGLILCKELITLHGGSIEVESKLNKGSTFIFTIPKDGKVRKV